MSLWIYRIFLFLYRVAIGCYAFFDQKAKKWINGRQDWQRKMGQQLADGDQRIWIHCASLGEFEQGRPLIESFKQIYPGYKIVLSFFSPSGYEVRKDYNGADYVFYLPLDGKKNARQFIGLVNPKLAIFVKYEFWHFYLSELNRLKIPTLLVSAAFRKEQVFFSCYGYFFRNLLSCFTWIFVQDEQSQILLKKIGFSSRVSRSGDTRYDRVAAIASAAKTIPIAAQFKQGDKLLIAGSTWPEDEKILADCMEDMPAGWKLVIAPHETDPAHIQSLQSIFGNEAVLYSSLEKGSGEFSKKCLIIDNIGLLSALFAYGDLAYIGGGFNKSGIHNILEPTVFGLPVIFGPAYKKFVEAVELVSRQYAFPVNNLEGCKKILRKLIDDEVYRLVISTALKKYMQENTGATDAILYRVREEKWI